MRGRSPTSDADPKPEDLKPEKSKPNPVFERFTAWRVSPESEGASFQRLHRMTLPQLKHANEHWRRMLYALQQRFPGADDMHPQAGRFRKAKSKIRLIEQIIAEKKAVARTARSQSSAPKLEQTESEINQNVQEPEPMPNENVDQTPTLRKRESRADRARRRQAIMYPILDEAFGNHTGYSWAKEAGMFVGSERKTVSKAAQRYLNGTTGTGRLRTSRTKLEEAIHRRLAKLDPAPKLPFTGLPD